MRKIKFRGKTETGKFIYSNSIEFEKIGGMSELQPYLRYNGEYVRVNPETVGQFTGIKDAEGVEIYEGDILAWMDDLNTPKMYVVKYDNRTASFRLFDSNEVRTRAVFDEYTCSKYRKIIGNIYDNTEFMKGE